MLEMIHQEHYPILYEELLIWHKAKAAADIKALNEKIEKAVNSTRKEKEETTILE